MDLYFCSIGRPTLKPPLPSLGSLHINGDGTFYTEVTERAGRGWEGTTAQSLPSSTSTMTADPVWT